jgi:hypothetical protein
MTFLNPAILLGLLAASIPIIIHLLNLKKLKTVEFSTLMFLKEIQKNKIRKIKIKQWLLLLLRTLIIIFIVLSFARPTLHGINIAGATSAAKTTSVFLLDNSFSMSLIDQKGSFLNQSKTLVEKIISQHQEGDELFVSFLLDDSVSFYSLNENNFSNTLNSSEVSYLKPDLQKSLISAAELVNKSKNFNREIFLFSDFQKNLLPEVKNKNDFSDLFNQQVKIYLTLFQNDDFINLSIDDLKPENQIIQLGSNISFVVTITNHSNQSFQNRVVSLFINNKRVAQKSFNIEPKESQKISIETTIQNVGYNDIKAEIEPDDIEYDNSYFLAFNIPDFISILILKKEFSNPDFVKLALQTLPNDRIKIIEKDIKFAQTINFDDFDVVIINSDFLTDIERLKNYLNSGGSVILIPNNNLNFNSFNNLINQLQLGIIDNLTLNNSNNIIKFDKVDFEHPILKDIFKHNQAKKFESPNIYQLLKNHSMLGTSIITNTDNSKFLIESKIGKGKLLFFNVAFNLGWTDFPLKSVFAPLIVKSVLYLSQKDFGSLQFLAGNEFNFNLEKIKSGKIKIQRPDNTEDYFQADNLNSNYLRYFKTDIKGIYRVFNGDKILVNFAVNHHSSESVQEFLSEKEFNDFLKSLNFKGTLVNLSPNTEPIEQIKQARFGTELWKFFILLAILTALVEMFIAKNNRKEIESLNENITLK